MSTEAVKSPKKSGKVKKRKILRAVEIEGFPQRYEEIEKGFFGLGKDEVASSNLAISSEAWSTLNQWVPGFFFWVVMQNVRVDCVAVIDILENLGGSL